jgi:glycosyltransferase involved in cell wall biosynthesis
MRIVYHCEDVVGARMAGPGIRAVELSRRLARRHEVILVADGAESFSGEPFRAGSLSELSSADAFISQGFGFPLRHLVRFRGRVVLDLYDPVQLEQLARFGARATAEQRVSLSVLRRRLQYAIGRADHVLCASAPQRALWLGWLGACGRLTPEALRDDPEARKLLAIVPFGVPETPPVPAGHPLRAAIGATADDRVVLWSGGLWDWMDPALAVRAHSIARRKVLGLKLALLAGTRPGSPAQRMTVAAEEARALAGQGVHFIGEWVPYADRGAWLLDADLAVTAHKPSLEAELAFRTRLLDCLWAHLPAAATSGDVLASLGEREGWARVSPPGDAELLAEAIISLTDPLTNSRAREAARAGAALRTWDASAAVLLDLLDAAPPARSSVIGAPSFAAAFARKAWRKFKR